MRKIRNASLEVPLPGFEEFHDEFLATRKVELIVLNEALGRQEFQVLSGYAHKWRGFSAPYGFQELGELANELEEQALGENTQSCEDILKRVADYLGAN